MTRFSRHPPRIQVPQNGSPCFIHCTVNSAVSSAYYVSIPLRFPAGFIRFYTLLKNLVRSFEPRKSSMLSDSLSLSMHPPGTMINTHVCSSPAYWVRFDAFPRLLSRLDGWKIDNRTVSATFNRTPPMASSTCMCSHWIHLVMFRFACFGVLTCGPVPRNSQIARDLIQPGGRPSKVFTKAYTSPKYSHLGTV